LKNHLLVIIALLSLSLLIFSIPGRRGFAHAEPEATHSQQVTPRFNATQTITINFGGAVGFAYSPSDVFILPSDTVHWQGSFATHPLVSDDGLWLIVGSGTEFEYTFNQPGIYHFHCSIHEQSGMAGSVTVGNPYFLPLING